METGVRAGYPMVDVRVTLTDGKYHDTDSSEIAFKVAGSLAFKEAAKRAKPVLLEPIFKVEVVTPEDFLGDVIGDLSRRRGRVEGQDRRGNALAVAAHVPLSEMFGYATDVRSMTQGRATYTMQFDKYEEVPPNIAEKIVAALKAAGLVSERRAGRNAYYRLRPEGLSPLHAWVERYRRFWPERMGRLKDVLKEMDG